jgi:hypothetical protein
MFMTMNARGKARRVGALIARPAVVVAGLALALGGCEDTRKALGFEKAPPDEFRIVSRPPLTMPPDYGLRPPTPGAVRPQQDNQTETARSALVEAAGGPRLAGNDAGGGGAVRAGESALVQRAAPGGRVDSSIRQTLDRENAQLAAGGDTYLLDRIMFWRKPDEQGTVIDAQREAQRLRENSRYAHDSAAFARRARGPVLDSGGPGGGER